MNRLLAALIGIVLAGGFANEQGTALKYHDDQPDGKQSLGGSGELIEFTRPAEQTKLAGLRIHGSRYGAAAAPEEDFLIHVLSTDRKRVLHTELAPYALFERGAERWVTVTFAEPVALPEHFWIALDFRAQQRKGVYVSYDTSTGGKNSRIGLPGLPAVETKFGGDWMIEAIMEK